MKIITIIILILTTSTASANIYVKDLHRQCLSKHQSCLLECAEVYTVNADEKLSDIGLTCAKTCKTNYIECEKILDTLKKMSDNTQITEDIPNKYKSILRSKEPIVFP